MPRAGSILGDVVTHLGVVGASFRLPPPVVALSGGAITRRLGRRPTRPA